MEVKNKKWTEEQLFKMRKEVLAGWQTSKDIDIDEAIAYRKALPENKKWVNVVAKAQKEGRILVGAHIGHTTVEETLEHLQTVQNVGGDFFHLCTDTYSRRGRFSEAEKALQESLRQGKPLLNGFPIVNQGLGKARYIRERIDVPMMLVSGEFERCMLLTEFGLAAGMEHVSSGVESVLRASKDYPLEQKIVDTQYMDRLAGYYTERGSPVHTYVLSHLSGLEPPGIKVALAVLNSILAAEQGIKHLALSLSLVCHVLQDAVAIRLVKQLAREYLKKFGYEDVVVSTTCFQFLGPWPREQSSAAAVSALNSTITILGGIDWFPVKSVAEAIGIPPKEANATAVRIAKKLIKTLGKQRLEEGPVFKLEYEMMRLEAEAIIKKVLELGNGDAAVGEIKAIESGVIDIPFSPCRKIKGMVYPLRDSTGAIRYLKHGNIPLPKKVIDYHKENLARRVSDEKKSVVSMMIDDVYYLSRD